MSKLFLATFIRGSGYDRHVTTARVEAENTQQAATLARQSLATRFRAVAEWTQARLVEAKPRPFGEGKK
jgi:hypothetical protein